MNDLGVLAVVSGFSGAGKGTVMKALLETHDTYALSVSATTRKPRAGEVNGVHYFFKSEQEFEHMIEEGRFIEYARYRDNYYGTPIDYVNEKLSNGRNVILEIEVQGALKVKEKIPEAVMIFITPPSVDELARRLYGRGTESESEIEGRLQRAAEEADLMEKYDYIITNDTVAQCVNDIHETISSIRRKPAYKYKMIRNIKNELKNRRKEHDTSIL